MAAQDADDGEYVTLTIPEAFLYRVPARTSAEGHKCVTLCPCA